MQVGEYHDCIYVYAIQICVCDIGIQVCEYACDMGLCDMGVCMYA